MWSHIPNDTTPSSKSTQLLPSLASPNEPQEQKTQKTIDHEQMNNLH